MRPCCAHVCSVPSQEGGGPQQTGTPEVSDDSNTRTLGNSTGAGAHRSRPSALKPIKPTAAQQRQQQVGAEKPQLSLPELSFDAAESQLDAGRPRSRGQTGAGMASTGAEEQEALEDSLSSPLRPPAHGQSTGPTPRVTLGTRPREISLSHGLGLGTGNMGPSVLASRAAAGNASGAGTGEAEAVVEESPNQGPGTLLASHASNTQPFTFPAPGAANGPLAGAAAAAAAAATAATAAPAGGKKGGSHKKGGAASAGKGSGGVPRVTRCGQCYSCLHKHLKKACERNKALKEGRTWEPESAATGSGSEASPAAAATTAAAAQPAQTKAVAPQSAAGAAGVATSGAANAGISSLGGRAGAQPNGAFPHAMPAKGGVLDEQASSDLQMAPEPWPVGQGQHPTARDQNGDTVMADADVRGAGAKGGINKGGEAGAGPGRATATGNRGSPAASAGTGAGACRMPPVPPGALSLAACLRHFVQPEMLSASENWVCSHCKRRQPALKQMSIRRLPPVLCLHLKRFEHCPGSRRIVRKLQAQLVFPTHCIDLEPYLSATVLRQR